MDIKLILHPPVKNPINRTNLFGTPSPMYTNLKQKGHPGLDFEAPSGTALYAPCDGLAFYVTDRLGGDGLWIRTTVGGQNYVLILWHLWPKGNQQFPFQIKTDGTMTAMKTGQLLAYTDNSGHNVDPALSESTAPHLHVGVMPCNPDWTPMAPNNGYLGCVDPMPFLSTIAAQDVDAVEKVITAATVVVNNVATTPDATPAQKLTWIQEIIAALEKLHL